MITFLAQIVQMNHMGEARGEWSGHMGEAVRLGVNGLN